MILLVTQSDTMLTSSSCEQYLSQRKVFIDVRRGLLANDRTDDVRRAPCELQQLGAVAPDVSQLRELAQAVLHLTADTSSSSSSDGSRYCAQHYHRLVHQSTEWSRPRVSKAQSQSHTCAAAGDRCASGSGDDTHEALPVVQKAALSERPGRKHAQPQLRRGRRHRQLQRCWLVGRRSARPHSLPAGLPRLPHCCVNRQLDIPARLTGYEARIYVWQRAFEAAALLPVLIATLNGAAPRCAGLRLCVRRWACLKPWLMPPSAWAISTNSCSDTCRGSSGGRLKLSHVAMP